MRDHGLAIVAGILIAAILNLVLARRTGPFVRHYRPECQAVLYLRIGEVGPRCRSTRFAVR
jgi:hypothetical protein